MEVVRNKVELLAPAAGFEVAKAAIDAGADAVYIGGPAFGARSRVGNSLEDLEKTVRYARRYAARCFLTLNTLVYDEELEDAVRLAWDAYRIGMDALLIQDLGLLQAELPPMELHASTQCHIDSVGKALFLQSLGFRRLVLARELSIGEIEEIVRSVDVEVETFIHGALCVSYSGQCYMSAYLNGRSGNRGECAQPCRLPYSLTDAQGRVLIKDRYLLSMKDLKADAYLDDLVRIGVSCLKIEGRLKDAGYVANIVSYYRKALDAVLEKYPFVEKASQGDVLSNFDPDPEKSFHRPYTDFNLSGRRSDWAVFESPKAFGKEMGRVGRVLSYCPGSYSGLRIELEIPDGAASFCPGDGICYFDRDGNLQGGQVERVAYRDGTFQLDMSSPLQEKNLPIRGSLVYRNRDYAFDKSLQAASFVRTLPVKVRFEASTGKCFMKDAYGNSVSAVLDRSLCQEARNEAVAKDNFGRQMAKMGGSAYRLDEFLYEGKPVFFVPAAVLNALRRELLGKMDVLRQETYRPEDCFRKKNDFGVMGDFEGKCLSYRSNCANSLSRSFYVGAGAEEVEPAFELELSRHRAAEGELLMVCKHCIRAQLGCCLKYDDPGKGYGGDLFLRSARHKFALHFDCTACRMEVRSCKD